MDTDLGIMIDGFRALAWLDEHSQAVGLAGGSCRECSAYAAALLHSYSPDKDWSPARILHLRCATAQAMQRQVDAAVEVIDRVCP